MNIKIGKYRLISSAKDFTISETKVGSDETKKNFGEEFDADKTYHPNLASALENVLNRKIKESEATTLKELLSDVTAARAELREIWGGLV